MKSRVRSCFVLGAVALALWPAAVVRADVIGPAADTYIAEATTTSNYGSATILLSKAISGSAYRRKVYVRFDLSDLSFYGGANAASATLTLNVVDTALGTAPSSSTAFNFAVYGLIDGFTKAGKLDETWAESGISWSNAPGNASGSGLDWINIYDGTSAVSAVKLATFTLMGKGVGTVTLDSATFPDLVSFLNDELADASPYNDGLVTFIILRETTEEASGYTYVHGFASKENGTVAGPSLEVIQAVPEPATLLLLSLAALPLLRRCSA
ncbi:MAG: hypothetical protein BIFFINMI_01522 [Phycisphaerae bacterium]|nr:hypothetical protein [Phycisphaerae bacterium]